MQTNTPKNNIKCIHTDTQHYFNRMTLYHSVMELVYENLNQTFNISCIDQNDLISMQFIKLV